MQGHSDGTPRIVITGLGVLCALGDNPEEVFRRMVRAETGIKPVTRFATDGFQCSIAGELEAEHRAKVLADESTASMDECARYAIYAARQALKDSGLEVIRYGPEMDGSMSASAGDGRSVAAERIGLVLGTCNGGILSLEKQWNLDNLDIANTANYPFYQQGDDTARALGLAGPVVTINTACAASGNAIGLAYDLIRWGYADVMLAGGSDPLSNSVYAGFHVLRALNPEPVSPFGSRFGLNLGEGTAFVVLERLDRALARGARIYGELCSYGLSNDAYHETAPHPEGAGMSRAVKEALMRGGIQPGQIGYINMHGTGTLANDRAEMTALRAVFGETLRVPVSSSKAYFGHNLGAAASLELVTALYAIRQGYAPGTLHFDEPREGCERADIIGPEMRPLEPEYMLSNNAAFGGHNVSLLLRTKVEGLESEPYGVSTVANARVAIAGIGAVGHWGIANGIPDPVTDGEDLERAAFSLKEFNPDKYERRMNALAQYTIGAAETALRHAGLDERMRADIGFVYGTSRGSTDSIARFLRSVFEKGPEFASSIYFPHTVINSIAGKTSEKLKLQGFSSSFSSGGCEGMLAALYAAGLIREGALDACLIGAGDERSLLSDAIDRAKGMDRSRFRRTEGSICMVLVGMERALERGLNLIAELKGFGAAFAATENEADREGALRRAMEAALDQAGLNLGDIDTVLVHAAGRDQEVEWARQVVSRQAGPDEGPLPQVVCLNDRYGYAESFGSMLHLAAAAEMVSKERQPKLEGNGKFRPSHALVIGMSMNGHVSAVVVSRIDPAYHGN